MTTCVTEGARRERHSFLAAVPLDTPLTKSEQKERLLAVYCTSNLQTVSAKVKEIITGDACYSGEEKQNYKIMMWNEAKLSSWSVVKFLVKKKMITVKFL